MLKIMLEVKFEDFEYLRTLCILGHRNFAIDSNVTSRLCDRFKFKYFSSKLFQHFLK